MADDPNSLCKEILSEWFKPCAYLFMEEVLSVPAEGEVLLLIVDALEVEVIVVHIIKCGSMDSIDPKGCDFRCVRSEEE